jgi:hypothetical protein
MSLPIKHSETVCKLCSYLLFLFAAAFGSTPTCSAQVDSLGQKDAIELLERFDTAPFESDGRREIAGPAKVSHGSTSIYELEKQRVDVRYSQGSCQIGGEVWNVAKDIVIRIEVVPRKSILIEDLHLNPQKYRRIPWSHPDNWVEYRNADEGIIVRTIAWRDKVEELYLTEYIPTSRDSILRRKKSAGVSDRP